MPPIADTFLPPIERRPTGDEKNARALEISQELLGLQKEQVESMDEATKQSLAFFATTVTARKKHEAMLNPLIMFLRKNAFNAEFIKQEKLKKEITKKQHQVVVKQNWFGVMLKKFDKFIASSGSFIMSLIGGLLALAVFDPKGKILKSIVGFMIKIINWLVNAIVQNLPWIVDNLIFLITEVLPGLLFAIGKALMNAMVKLFTSGFDKIKDASSLFKFITQKLLIFGGILLGINKILGGIIPISTVFIKMLSLFGSIIFSIPGAIAGALVLIYVFRDKIAGFFESIFGWFMKLGIVAKVIVGIIFGAVATLFGPLTAIVIAVYGLAKLFQFMAKRGWKKTFKDIWDWLKKTATMVVKAVWRFIRDLPGNLWKWIKEGASSLGNWFSSIGRGMWDFLKEWVFQPLKDFWNDIVNWIDGIARIGLFDYMRLGSKEKEAYSQLNKQLQVLEKAEEGGQDMSKLPKDIGRITAALHDESKMKDLIKDIAKGNKITQTELTRINKINETNIRKEEQRVVSKKVISSARGGY